MKFSVNNLIIINFFFVIILFPINFKIISFVRPADLILIFFSFLLLSKIQIKRDYLILIALPIAVTLLSTLISFSDYKNEFLGSSIYLYKLLIIYIVIMGTIYVCENDKGEILNKILFLLFLLLILYSFVYSAMIYFEVIVGNKRISYPFTVYEDRLRSDAHLYGNYLSLNLIIYVLYWMKKFNHNYITSFIIQFICISAILLTGSKNPLLILVLFYLGLFGYYFYRNVLLKINLWKTFYFIFFVLFLYLLYIVFNNQINYLYYIIIDFVYANQYHLLVTRIIYFIQNPFDDDSALGRINNLLYALRISEPYFFILGKGLNGEFRFFDGIHSIFIAIGGFSLLFLLIVNVTLIIGKIIFVNKINGYKILFLIFLFFLIISNLITEFIFVTRWMIPIISLSTMLYFYSFKNKQNKMKNVT